MQNFFGYFGGKLYVGVLYMLKGSLMANVIIYLLVLAFLILCGTYFGNSLFNNYRIGQIQREAVLLDNALAKYSSNHIGVNENTIGLNEEENKIVYRKTNLYPISLSELGRIRSEDNYFSDYIDLDRWTYQVRWVSGNMVYDLRSELPDGTIYHSPCSKP